MKALPALLLAFICSSPLAAEEKAAQPAKAPAEEEPAKAKTPPPKTLEEAHLQLEALLPKAELAKIDAMETETEMIEYHFSLGMSMRNTSGLWGDSPLTQHMNELGFHHADDISGVILETFWCKRHRKDFRLKERATAYDAYWKASTQPPDTVKDPQDGSEVNWKMSMPAEGSKSLRIIHPGQSKKTGRWLVYEHDKGIYVPDEALLKRLNESNQDPFSANP